jgi:osmotically-inducible protein OsmY
MTEVLDRVRAALGSARRLDLHSLVRLTGVVPSTTEREMAEFDAWYVFGVDNVDNRIEVRA